MDFLNVDFDDPGLCYTKTGMLRVLLYNTGDVPIENFLITVYGNSSIFSADIPQYISTTDAIPLDIGFPRKEVGQVQNLVLTPRAKYKNKTITCHSSERFVATLRICDDVRQNG